MLDPFLDTILICTMTAIIILLPGQFGEGGVVSPAILTAESFAHALPGTWGKVVVSVALAFLLSQQYLAGQCTATMCYLFVW